MTQFEKQYMEALVLEDYPYLPMCEEEVVEKYEVQPSKDADIEYFTRLVFDADEALERLMDSSLYGQMENDIFQQPYSGCDLSQPIVPVSKEISYLLAVSGGGQGLAGNEDDGTLHLQRGVARKVSEEEINYDEDMENPKSMTVMEYTKIKLNIIQNNGVITQL